MSSCHEITWNIFHESYWQTGNIVLLAGVCAVDLRNSMFLYELKCVAQINRIASVTSFDSSVSVRLFQ